MPMRSASSTSSSWRRNISTCVEFSRGVVVDHMASLTVSSSLYSTSACSRGSPHGPRRGWLRQSPHSACSMAMNGGVSAERKRHRPQDHVLGDGPVHFTLPISISAKVTSLHSQVVDRVWIERLDPRREQMDPRSDEAPAFIRIDGLARIAGVPDGEWRLARGSPTDRSGFRGPSAAHGLDHAVMNAALE